MTTPTTPMTPMTSSDPPFSRRITTDTIRERIAMARGDGMPRQELEVLETDAINALKRELRAMKTEFAKAMLPGLDAEMVVRDACTAVSRTEGLWEAEPSTVLGAAMTAAQLGLRIGVLGHSWILPFWSSHDKTQKAQLMIGYQGYIDLCYRSGLVVDMATEIVYQKEADAGRFDFWRTEDRPHLLHKPLIDDISTRDSCPLCQETDPRCDNIDNHGDRIHAFYACARTKGGGFNVTRPWGLNMMLAHRARYAKKDRHGRPSLFWTRDFPAAGRKTMARELTRLLPKTTQLANALYADEGVRNTFSPRMEAADATEHENYDGVIVDGVDGVDGADAGSADASRAATAEHMETETLHPADRD